MTLERRTRIGANLIAFVDATMFLWGAMAFAMPHRLLGPGGTPILQAGFEGYTRESWIELTTTSPAAAGYIEIVFRLYGLFCGVLGLVCVAIALTALRRGESWAWWTLLVGSVVPLVSAMRYDWIVNAIGPFEVTEYVGLALVVVALTMTAPIVTGLRSARFAG